MRIAVIGGGIQGISASLELARRGAHVDLLESREAPMLGASRESEGKIHLGFVYANDPGLETVRLMSEGAYRFAPLLARWLECSPSALRVSTPFYYAVHRGSLLPADELEGRYRTMAAIVRAAGERPGASYFGISGAHRIRRLPPALAGRLFDDRSVQAVFESREVALDPRAVAELLAARVREDPRIRVRTRAHVVSARTVGEKVELAIREGEERRERYDHVVNCAWCGRLAIDATLGIEPPGPWSFRRKFFLRVPARLAPAAVPTLTIVLGAFGDVVRYDGGDLFLSWYPIGRQGIERARVPAARPEPLAPERARTLQRGIVRALADVVPAVGALSAGAVASSEVADGVIFALGTTDVDDRGSRFHRRDEVGPRSFGRFHSVDTGKYTLAPLFACRLADRILPEGGAA